MPATTGVPARRFTRHRCGTDLPMACSQPAPDGLARPVRSSAEGSGTSQPAMHVPAQITRICADQAGTIVRQPAAPNGGLARGYPARFASLAARSCPSAVSPELYLYAAVPSG
jgi:hypothetical protein